MKEHMLLFMAFARVYRRMILLWLAFYIPLLFSLRHQKSLINSFDKTTWDIHYISVSTYGMIVIIVVGVILLGRAFHSNRQHTWMRRLPVSKMSFDLCPLTLVFLVSFVTLTIPWRTWLSINFGQGPQTVVYLVALPLTVFLLSQRIRNISAAIACASLLVGGFQFANSSNEIYGLFTAYRNGFIIEASTACVLSLIVFAVMFRRWWIGMFTCVWSFFIASLPLIMPLLPTHNSLGDLAFSYQYFPTSIASESLRHWALHPELWTEDEGSIVQEVGAIYIASRHIVPLLSDQEQAQFVSALFAHAKSFTKKYNKGTPAEAEFTSFPILPGQLKSPALEILWKNAKYSSRACHLLPKSWDWPLIERTIVETKCLDVTRMYHNAEWLGFSPFSGRVQALLGNIRPLVPFSYGGNPQEGREYVLEEWRNWARNIVEKNFETYREEIEAASIAIQHETSEGMLDKTGLLCAALLSIDCYNLTQAPSKMSDVLRYFWQSLQVPRPQLRVWSRSQFLQRKETYLQLKELRKKARETKTMLTEPSPKK